MGLPEDIILENRYRIDRLLAQGGMGSVYRGFDLKLKISVALKENFFHTPQSIRQFEQEALILARLHHPNLPRVIDYFTREGQQYLVMDYIEGQDLWDMVKMREQPLEERQALTYMTQVCDAVSYLHHQVQPIIHRDIKPQNIKVTPHGRVMLVDFGIAKIAQGGERTVTGARGGTPGFSPPEQYSGSGTTPVSDIYSLGATLYAVLTGQKPPDSISLLVNQAKFKPPTELNPKLSREVSEAILWAMQPRLEERPQSVTAWREALEGILKAPGRSSQAEATITDCATVMESTGRDVSPPIPPVLPDSGQQTKRTVVKWGIGIGLIAIVILVVLAAAITFLAINRGGKTVNIDTLLAVFSIPTQQPDGKPQTETDPEVGVVVTAEASGQIETPLVSNNSTTPESADTLIAPTSTRQSKPTNIPIPATKTPKPKPTATPTIDTGSYSHDFSFDDGNWDTGQRNYDSGSIDMNLVDGKYRVSITPKLDDYAYRFCPDKVNGWKDFVVSVDMWPISGPFPMYYGIYFRGTDWDNYYRLIITNDSKYSVLVEKGGQFQELVTWSYSPAIQNAEKNHVKIEANGSTIKFYVNSQYLTTVDDDKLKRGDVCFWIGQWGDYYAGSITTIDFDNLSITALP